MKQLITAVVLATAAITAQAQDFQQVYEAPGKTAEQIVKAANINKPKMDIVCRSWGVSLVFNGDVIIEAKDGRYRLTFENMRSIDSGASLASLPQTQTSCKAAMTTYGDNLNKKINSWKDF
jgi:hypothetical protein